MKNRKYILRFSLHVLYWALFFGALFVFTDFKAFNINFFTIDFPITLFYSYFTAYVLIPYFFPRNRYLYFILSLLVLSMVLSYIRLTNYNYLYYSVYQGSLDETQHKFSFAQLVLNAKDFSFGLLIFLATKFTRNWITSEKDRLEFEKEKTESEFRLMKSQIDPHFLFNTLNNLYSLSVVDPQRTSPVIKKFWGIMDYLVNECSVAEIPLEKEIKLISDYVELERIRYSERLYFEFNVTGEMNSKMIPPLVFFPLVENCFKHGSSNDPGQPWIKLYLEETRDGLRFTASNSLFNSKDPVDSRPFEQSEARLQERLGALLPGRFRLKTDRFRDMYIVKLEVLLQ